MTNWNPEDLRRLDRKFAEAGIHVHQRPFHAATELLGSAFAMGRGANPEVQRIMEAYAALVPEVNLSWPGAGIGLVASVDQVRKIILPVMFGQHVMQVWQLGGFASAVEWWAWCREDGVIAAEASFSVADLHDFSIGLGDIGQSRPAATTLWQMSRSNLQDVAHVLPTSFSHDSVLQSVCMVAELAIKAALVWGGTDPESFRGKGGHNLIKLAERMANTQPHRDDGRVQAIVASLPPYVDSRYRPAGLTRLKVVRLALGTQFVAASSLRRATTVDLAKSLEEREWPGSRANFIC